MIEDKLTIDDWIGFYNIEGETARVLKDRRFSVKDLLLDRKVSELPLDEDSRAILVNEINRYKLEKAISINLQPVEDQNEVPDVSEIIDRNHSIDSITDIFHSLKDLTIDDVKVLLQTLSLDHYIDEFEKNRISGQTLFFCENENHVMELGIDKSYHARTLWNYIKDWKLKGVDIRVRTPRTPQILSESHVTYGGGNNNIVNNQIVTPVSPSLLSLTETVEKSSPSATTNMLTNSNKATSNVSSNSSNASNSNKNSVTNNNNNSNTNFQSNQKYLVRSLSAPRMRGNYNNNNSKRQDIGFTPQQELLDNGNNNNTFNQLSPNNNNNNSFRDSSNISISGTISTRSYGPLQQNLSLYPGHNIKPAYSKISNSEWSCIDCNECYDITSNDAKEHYMNIRKRILICGKCLKGRRSNPSQRSPQKIPSSKDILNRSNSSINVTNAVVTPSTPSNNNNNFGSSYNLNTSSNQKVSSPYNSNMSPNMLRVKSMITPKTTATNNNNNNSSNKGTPTSNSKPYNIYNNPQYNPNFNGSNDNINYNNTSNTNSKLSPNKPSSNNNQKIKWRCRDCHIICDLQQMDIQSFVNFKQQISVCHDCIARLRTNAGMSQPQQQQRSPTPNPVTPPNNNNNSNSNGLYNSALSRSKSPSSFRNSNTLTPTSNYNNNSSNNDNMSVGGNSSVNGASTTGIRPLVRVNSFICKFCNIINHAPKHLLCDFCDTPHIPAFNAKTSSKYNLLEGIQLQQQLASHSSSTYDMLAMSISSNNSTNTSATGNNKMNNFRNSKSPKNMLSRSTGSIK